MTALLRGIQGLWQMSHRTESGGASLWLTQTRSSRGDRQKALVLRVMPHALLSPRLEVRKRQEIRSLSAYFLLFIYRTSTHIFWVLATWKALVGDTLVNRTHVSFSSRLHSFRVVGPMSNADALFCRVRRWIKAGKGTSSSGCAGKGFLKVTFERRLEGGDGVSHAGSGENTFQMRPEAAMQVHVWAEAWERREPGESGRRGRGKASLGVLWRPCQGGETDSLLEVLGAWFFSNTGRTRV